MSLNGFTEALTETAVRSWRRFRPILRERFNDCNNISKAIPIKHPVKRWFAIFLFVFVFYLVLHRFSIGNGDLSFSKLRPVPKTALRNIDTSLARIDENQLPQLSNGDSTHSIPFPHFPVPWWSARQLIDLNTRKVNFTHFPLTFGRPIFDFESCAMPKQATEHAADPYWAPLVDDAGECSGGNRELDPPILSVITPIYNTERAKFTIGDSILKSSLQQLEWIIINDGSTDKETLSLLSEVESLSRRNPRVRYLDLGRNVGLPQARNHGARIAHPHAKYLIFADADDILETSYLEKCVIYLHFHPGSDICSSWSYNFGAEQFMSVNTEANNWRIMYDNPGFARNGENLHNNNLMSMSMVRRSAFEAVGGYDASIKQGMEDWDLWLHFLSAGRWGVTLKEFLFWYRVSPRDRWASISDPKRMAAFKDRLKQKYAKMYHRYDELKEDVSPWQKLVYDRRPYQLITEEPPLFNRLTRNYASPLHSSSSSSKSLQLRRPRLMLVTHFSVIGGAEIFNVRVMRELARAGWELTLVFTLPENLRNTLMPQYRAYSNDIFTLSTILEPAHYGPFIVYLLQSRRPDVVLLANSESIYLQMEYIRHYIEEHPLLMKSTVVMDYIHAEQEEWKNGGYSRFTLHHQYFLDRTLFCAASSRDWLVAHGGDPRKTGVVYIGTDSTYKLEQIHAKQELERQAEEAASRTAEGKLKAMKQKKSATPKPTAAAAVPNSLSLRDPLLNSQIRVQYNLTADTVVILYVARLEMGKLPYVFADSLIQLAGHLAARGPSHRFHAFVLGDGDEGPALRQYVSESAVASNVTFVGMVTKDDVMHAYQCAGDIVYLPSLKEGISLGLLDGMAYGMVPVSVILGGQAEIIQNDVNGYLIPYDPRDKHANMARQFSTILADLVLDRAHLDHMSAAALNRIQLFTTEAMVRSLQRETCIAFRQKQELWKEKGLKFDAQMSALDGLCPNLEASSSSLLGSADTPALISPYSPRLHSYQVLQNAHFKSDYVRMENELLANWKTYEALVASSAKAASAASEATRPSARGQLAHLGLEFINGVTLLSGSWHGTSEVRKSSADDDEGSDGVPVREFHLDLLFSAAQGNLSASNFIFVHVEPTAESLENPPGDIKPARFQADHLPTVLGATRTTDTWRVGEFVFDQVSVRIPDESGPGEYSIRMGIFMSVPPYTRLEMLDTPANKAQAAAHEAKYPGSRVDFGDREIILGRITLP